LRLRVKFLVFAVDSYIDIDSVKQVNNKLGHAAGDYLLRYIARSMKKMLRKTDFIARMGSDEFTVLFPEIDEKGVKRATEKLREYLANKMTQNQTDVTFSVEIACFLTSPQYSAEELVKKAYNLMAQAKE
jgi:diguanylate cyclase